MPHFKEKDSDQKNKKAAFTVAWMKFLLNFSSTEDNPRENNCRKVFAFSPKYDNGFTPETVHAVISVIHEKVYDIIQIEVSRKKLKSSTSVASSSSKAETQPERKETRYFIDLVAPRQIEWSSRENKHWHWMGEKEEQICPNEKWKPKLCILKALKMKDNNLPNDESSLQASVLVFFIFSTKSYWSLMLAWTVWSVCDRFWHWL